MYQEIGWLTFTFFLFIYINPHADCVGATRNISPRAAPLPSAAPAALTGIRNPDCRPACSYLLSSLMFLPTGEQAPRGQVHRDWDLYSKWVARQRLKRQKSRRKRACPKTVSASDPVLRRRCAKGFRTRSKAQAYFTAARAVPIAAVHSAS